MKVKRCCLALTSFAALVLSGPAWPLTIESPRPGERVMPGQTVWLIVQPSSADETDVRAVQVVAPGAGGCEDVQPTIPIQCALTVPDGSNETPVPNAVDIRVQVTFASGALSSAKTYITVAETRTLAALDGDPRDSPLVFEAVGQQRNLTVIGRSTEGATHDLRGRQQGTVYDISNPAVVTVSNDGRVIAQGVGTATITVPPRSGLVQCLFTTATTS